MYASSKTTMVRSGTRAMKRDRKSTRLNSSHSQISYAVFCLKKKKNNKFSNIANLYWTSADSTARAVIATIHVYAAVSRLSVVSDSGCKYIEHIYASSRMYTAAPR